MTAWKSSNILTLDNLREVPRCPLFNNSTHKRQMLT